MSLICNTFDERPGISKNNSNSRLCWKKSIFWAIFTFFYLAERSAGRPKVSADFAENFGRIFGFGRTLMNNDLKLKNFMYARCMHEYFDKVQFD